MSKKSTIEQMLEVRAANWFVEGLAADGSEWRVLYHGPHMRSAINAVQDHDTTRVTYLYGTWRELT